jgi:excisionase family DNA binding protein
MVMADVEERTYSTQEAADLIGVHKNTILRWIDLEYIKAVKKTAPGVRRHAIAYRVPQSEIDRLIKESESQSQE